MAETVVYRSIIVASQLASWLFGQILRARYSVSTHGPVELFEDRDGGTLQIGIGALEDAVTYMLKLRHQQNDLYRETLAAARVLERFAKVIERLGGTGPFKSGLYASSEMLVRRFPRTLPQWNSKSKSLRSCGPAKVVERRPDC